MRPIKVVGLDPGVWKPIPNYLGYEASNMGNVRSWNPRNGVGLKGSAEKPTLLKPSKFRDSGYLRVGMRNSTTGKYDSRRVHQVVLEAFEGPKPFKSLVMHLNDLPHDNRLINLRYGTPKENQQDMVDKGRSCCGESHPKSLVSNGLRQEIINLAYQKQYRGSRLEIAKLLEIPVNFVRRVIENNNLKARKEGKQVATIKSSRA